MARTGLLTDPDASRRRIEVPPHLHMQMVHLARDFRKAPTRSEQLLWHALRRGRVANARFRRQQPIGPFIVDFYCPRHGLVVEVDGPIHAAQVDRDQERQALLEACGYRVLRIQAADVEADLPAVLRHITEFVATSPLSP